MPSAGGHGVVSSYYRTCLRFADVPPQAPRTLSSFAPIQEGTSPTVKIAVSSQWAAHAAEVRESHAPLPVPAGIHHEADRSPLGSRPSHADACLSIEQITALLPPPSIAHKAPLSRRTMTCVWGWTCQPTRQVSDDHMGRFLRLRGIFSVTSSTNKDSASLDSAEAAIASGTTALTSASESTFVKRMFAPSSAILPAFFAGIFILEIGGALDIYDGIGAVFTSSPETDTSLALLALLFVVGIARFVSTSVPNWARRGTCTRHGKGFGACRWRTGPRSQDNAVLLLSWTVVIAALTAQVRCTFFCVLKAPSCINFLILAVVGLYPREGALLLLRALCAIVDVECGDGIWVYSYASSRFKSSRNCCRRRPQHDVDALGRHWQHPSTAFST